MGSSDGKNFRLSFTILSPLLKSAWLATLILTSFFISRYFKVENCFPIKTVQVYGAEKVDRQEIQDILLPLVKRGFFSINVDYIKDRLSQIPWVSTAFVRLYWPDRVEVNLIEKKPIAIWNGNTLLSDSGELFTPNQTTFPEHLPKFYGPNGRQILMITYYNDINRLFMPLHVKIVSLEVSPYLNWSLKLDNGISLHLGHKDILTRLDHFVKVYAKIVGDRVADVDYIDLRYPNGLAVRWKAML